MRVALAAVLLLAGIAGGCDAEEPASPLAASSNLIQEDRNNRGVEITVGSKNFTEQYVLGEIYAQALEAAGYDVRTKLDLGSERAALRALRAGEVDAYPEYTSTALTSFFDLAPEDVPADAGRAYEETTDDFGRLGLVAFPPTPFSSANAVGLLTETADELDVTTISDLESISDELTLYGAPECRRRIDCLRGLERYYDLQFKDFVPVEIGRRYDVLASGDADLSILFTTDPSLFASDDFVTLEDDREALPAGNVLLVAREQTVDEAGPDLAATIESVQRNLTLDVMQELNARVDIDGEDPEAVARHYLEEFGYLR